MRHRVEWAERGKSSYLVDNTVIVVSVQRQLVSSLRENISARFGYLYSKLVSEPTSFGRLAADMIKLKFPFSDGRNQA